MRSIKLALPTFVALVALVVGGGSATRAAGPAPTDPAQTDARIRVVLFPFAGTASDAVRKAGQMALPRVAKQINDGNPLYWACLQDAASAGTTTATACDASQANVIVSTTLRAASGGDATLVVQSVDLSGHRTLGSIQKTIASRTSLTSASSDATTAANLTGALDGLSDADIRVLIGTPAVRDGRLSIQPGFQPFVQLVPDVSSSDPTYVAVLQNLLAKRGIASVPSQFNAGTVTSGNAGADALCGLGQRYLVYSVANRTEDRLLSFNTRIETRATGHLYDCPTHSDLAFGDTAHAFAPNTKLSLAPVLALLGSLFVSKSNSWQNAATTGTLVGAVVDVAPEKLQERTAEITLQKLVDSLCDRLEDLPSPQPAVAVVQNAIPTPSPSPSPVPSDFSGRHGILGTPSGAKLGAPPVSASRTTGTSATAGTAETALPLDIGNFLSDTPPPLRCGRARYRDPSPGPASAPLFERRP